MSRGEAEGLGSSRRTLGVGSRGSSRLEQSPEAGGAALVRALRGHYLVS